MEPHSVIGFCNVLCRFDPKFTRIASPLTARLHRSQAKQLGQQNEEKMAASRIEQEKQIFPLVLFCPGKENIVTSTQTSVID